MRAKGRQLRGPGGRNWLPKRFECLPKCAVVTAPACEAWLGRGLVGAFVFHAVAVSLNDDCLPVMHQPVDHGSGQPSVVNSSFQSSLTAAVGFFANQQGQHLECRTAFAGRLVDCGDIAVPALSSAVATIDAVSASD